MRDKIKEIISSSVPKAMGNIEISDFSVETSEDIKHGDYAANIALILAKVLKKNPLEIAGDLKSEILNLKSNLFERVEIAPPGFINFWLSQEILLSELDKVLKLKTKYGRSQAGKGKKVMVEFTDPNPFKEFHIGHLYSNIAGEALCRILEANGANVKRANYQGDVGLHVAKAIWGMQEKMKKENIGLAELGKKPLDYRIKFMGQAYAQGNIAFSEDTKAKLEIAGLNKKIFALDDKEIKSLYEQGRKWSLEYFEKIYKRLGTKFDFYYFERKAGEDGLRIVQENLGRVFEKSEGAIVFPGEKYGLHRRVFVNSEGLPTYEAKELGLAPAKFKNFPCDLSIIVTGSEVIDYFKVLLAALKLINPELGEKTKHMAHGMVRFPHGKMSSRAGDAVRAEDLLEETKNRVLKIMASSSKKISGSRKENMAEIIALGAIKYSFLKSGLGSDIVFDFDKSLSLQGGSGPYLQYTYARLKSILRKADRQPKKITGSFVLDQTEHRLLSTLLRFPEVVEDALRGFSPNTIANYLYTLAEKTNNFYHSHPVLQEKDESKKQFRLALVAGLTLVLANGLLLLGIKAPEEM